MSNREPSNRKKVDLQELFPNGYPQTMLELVLALGGGWIPENGEYSLKLWSIFLGKCVNTVNGYRKKYRIPSRQQGDEIFMDAADFRSHVPKHYWDEQEE